MLVFVYGIVCYVIFFATFLAGIGFLGNFGVPWTIDAAPRTSATTALAVDVALLTVFAMQHSVMARRGFKEWWTRIVPQPAERSTYVLFSSLALLLLFTQWQPIGGSVWTVTDPIASTLLYTLFGAGWLLVLTCTFLIDHFDLFGLRQVWLHLRGRTYTPPIFRTPGPYKLVRHPLYVGWLLAFWATPTMTIAHFVFALTTTAYILVAIRLEERDLVHFHGSRYEDYRRRVPMLVPGLGREEAEAEPSRVHAA